MFGERCDDQEKVIKLVDIGMPNLWRHFKDGVLEACGK